MPVAIKFRSLTAHAADPDSNLIITLATEGLFQKIRCRLKALVETVLLIMVLGSGRNTQITGENKNNELDLKGDRKRRLESLGTNVMIAMTFELNRGRQCALHNPPTQKN